MKTSTIAILVAAAAAAGVVATGPGAHARSTSGEAAGAAHLTTSAADTTALSALRQATVDRANALLTADLKYQDAAGTIRLSRQPSANRNVLELNASNTNRNELNAFSAGYSTGLDWCGYFVARTWTGVNAPRAGDYPRLPTYYLRSQAWRTDPKTPYHRFSASRLPKPGDVLVWQNGAGSAGDDNGNPYGHVGVVTAVNATTKVITSVEGNVAGDEIRRFTYTWDADGPTKADKHFMGHTARE